MSRVWMPETSRMSCSTITRLRSMFTGIVLFLPPYWSCSPTPLYSSSIHIGIVDHSRFFLLCQAALK